jgi:DNA-binding NtrC family response regulator
MKNLLVIDNDRDLLQIIRYVLQDAGYTVNVLNNEDSIDHLKQNLNPVIMIDQWLSSGAGKNLCLQLKLNGRSKKAQVLLMGVQNNNSQMVKNYCTHARYIKPFDIKTLLKTVNKNIA